MITFPFFLNRRMHISVGSTCAVAACVLLSRHASAAEVIYSYDPLNRLTNTVHGSLASDGFAYDAAGNRLRREIANMLSIQRIPDRTVVAGTAFDSIPLSIDGADSGNSLSISVRSSNPNLVTKSGIAVSGEGLNRSFSITPNLGATGSASIKLIASDGNVATATSFIVTVIPAPPSLSISDCTAIKSGADIVLANFRVTLSSPQAESVSVSYATADGDARAGIDYNPTSGPLQFAPGETEKTVTVQVHSDSPSFGDWYFHVNLTAPFGAALARAQGTCMIHNEGFPDQTIDFGPISNRTYGDPPFRLSAIASSGLPVVFIIREGTPFVSITDGQMLVVNGAGSVVVEASQAGNASWLLASPMEQSFTIAKAELHAKAKDETRMQGVPNPEFRVEYGRFVNGETEAVLDSRPVPSTSATLSSPAGAYPIVLSGGFDANYEIRTEDGVLTVTAPRIEFIGFSIENGRLFFALLAPPGSVIELQSSADFLSWTHIQNATVSTNGTVELTVDFEPQSERRIFRARQVIEVQPRPDYVRIEPGSFTMGSREGEPTSNPDEYPQTSVTITRPYWMSTIEVTQNDFEEIMGFNPSLIVDPALPVFKVKWAEADAYCRKLTEIERAAGRLPHDYEYRLPTEAEWEFAYRGTTTTPFPHSSDPFGREVWNYGWLHGNSNNRPHPAKERQIGLNGLYDMAGNVWEWCSDWYAPYHPGGTVADPLGPLGGIEHVTKGGCWSCGNDGSRSGARNYGNDIDRFDQVGFRPALAQVDDHRRMSFIPAGPFQMGDDIDAPVHTVTLDAFWIDRTEVAKWEWDLVYAWAITNGYSFTNPGQGVALNHPIHTISWFDAIKWCNAKSRKEGLTPVYYLDRSFTQEYRQGEHQIGNEFVNWSANGHRLPTDAEWEKAARGGLVGKRYPWGDDIEGNQANYANSGDPFDSAPAPTTPVAFYNGHQSPGAPNTANGFGLYDVMGNVWETVWDFYGPLTEEAQANPHGPPSVEGINQKLLRGGDWSQSTVGEDTRCARRQPGGLRSATAPNVGFRTARSR